MKKLFLGILLFSSIGEAAQTFIPSTCYVRGEKFFVATTVSVLVASSLDQVNCYVLQNKDAAASVFGSINASTGTQGFEIQAGSIYQLYIGPSNTLYLRSSAGSVNLDILSGRTTY